MGCLDFIVNSSILSFVLLDSRMVSWSQLLGPNFPHQGSTWCEWTNPQNTISGRDLLRHCCPCCTPMDIHSSSMYSLNSKRFLTKATFRAHPILNIVFGLVFTTSMYCFTQAVVSDPGYIPRPAGISEQKKIVEELVVRGEFDPRHFCTSCFVRKSLRSKHCRICERCVARHDQYFSTYLAQILI